MVGESSLVDFHWDNPDGHEEKLMSGLYFRTHTVDSLSKELGYAFNVIECLNQKYDPRYIICVVKPKGNLDSLPEKKDTVDWGKNAAKYLNLGIGSIPGILDQLETICSFLESHEKNVSQYFEDDYHQGKSPLQDVPVKISEFWKLLEVAFRSLPGIDKTCSPNLRPRSFPSNPE